ncbi:hypothetical protein LQL77_31260 [Rhodococcus cerastii]|nr:hypothetical protein [Rhodococcus cerastii]
MSRQKGYGRFTSIYVDATPALEHVDTLLDTGIGIRTLAAAAGVSTRTVQRLLSRRSVNGPVTVRSCTAAALLAVRAVPPAPCALIDATGTRRRLQALVALGWPQKMIAHELGMVSTNIGRIVHGRSDRVTVAKAAEVTALYTRWEMLPGPSMRARGLAAAHHWIPPLGWEENTLDDPHATPIPASCLSTAHP